MEADTCQEELTDEALRIAVAEAMGWEFPVDLPAQRAAFLGYPYFGPGIGWGDQAERAPDFPNDLNACRQFEERLTERERDAYANEFQPTLMPPPREVFRLATIPPRQRCLAFLRVKSTRAS